jgi:hypothetical protein
MKRIIFAFLLAFVIQNMSFASDFSKHRGVWASNDAEAVVTDSVCMFFEKTPTGLRAFLNVPSRDIYSCTTYKDSAFVVETTTPLILVDEVKTVDGITVKTLRIGDKVMSKVEDIKTCKPYEKSRANSKMDIGKCLQEWRLGAKFEKDGDVFMCEINTNRHMFVYLVNTRMIYIRAAATANNNNGTLFFQNIRMMHNNNTGEMTSYIAPDNYNIAVNNLKIDNSKFNPNACVFNPDGGIYWSLISFTADQIQINGCGETYYINRIDQFEEYFKYTPYSKPKELL